MSKKLDQILNNVGSENIDPISLDSDLTAASDLAKKALAEKTVDNLTQRVIDRLNDEAHKAKTGNVVGASAGFASAPIQESHNPDVQIVPPPSSADQNTKPPLARPATKVDLASLDESNILDLDFVEAKSLDVPAMLQLTPKDPSIRFRWVNYKNYEGGNYAMFKAIGFSNAQPADVAGELSEHLRKEDGTIKWFDVVLMKVNVLTLMGVYKKNIIKALTQVGRWQPAAIKQAKRTIEHELGADIWEQLKKHDKNVEFYAPTVKEMASQDQDFETPSNL